MSVAQKQLIAIILFLLLHVSTVSAQKITVAVVDLEGIGISQVEAVALSNRLRNELFRLGAFKVVDRGLMQAILEEQNLQQTGCTSNECLVELGRLLGVQQMIGGSISKIEKMFSVSTRVVDVETGEVISVSDYDREAGLSEILTKGMRDVALSLSGLSEEIVSNTVERKGSKPVERSPNQSIKQFTLAFGSFIYKGGRDDPFASVSFRTRRTFGYRFPIRPVLTAYYIDRRGRRNMASLEASYTIEGPVFRPTFLLGIGGVEGDRYGPGPTFGIQIEMGRRLPVMIDGRIVGRAGQPHSSLGIGIRF